MGLKYYVSLIIRKFHFYEKLWKDDDVKLNFNAVLSLIIEIAKDDKTISVKDYEEILFTYKTYLDRYEYLVDITKELL